MVDGQAVSTWLELVGLLEVADGMPVGVSSSSLYKQVLAAGDEVIFLDFRGNPAIMELFSHEGHRVSMEICYNSIYDEYWLVSRDKFNAEGVSSSVSVATSCFFQETDNYLN